MNLTKVTDSSMFCHPLSRSEMSNHTRPECIFGRHSWIQDRVFMKPSRYNLFFRSKNGATLAFNSASAALAEILPENLPAIQRLLDQPDSAQTDEERAFRSALDEGRYLVPDQLDELTALKIRNRSQRFGNQTLMLTIAPTLACNFRCDYCFECKTAARMDQDTEKAVLEFAAKRIRRCEEIYVTWFGGEPTLCIETIERLQLRLRELAAQHQVSVRPSAIITNGYLLDAAIATRLKNAGVEEAQVTLDGPAEIHDTRRKLANGRGTYQRIMENLKQSAEILQIGVRVNVDRLNIDSTRGILDDLRANGLIDKVFLYFAQVTASTTVCADIRDRCLSTEEFSRGQIDMYQKLIDSGFFNIEYPMLAPGGHCGADVDNAFVIGPNGDLFKCWEELSTDHSHTIGSVFQPQPNGPQLETLHTYMGWDPFERAGCRECEVLPICMGGCPRHAIHQDDKTRGACCSWKYNLREMLTLRHQCELGKEAGS